MQTIVFTEHAATLCNRLEVEPLINLLTQPIERGGESPVTSHIGEDEAAVAKTAITRSMQSLLIAGVLPRGMVLERKIASSVLSDVKEPLLLPPWKESDEESPRRSQTAKRIQTARRSQAILFEPGKDLMK